MKGKIKKRTLSPSDCRAVKFLISTAAILCLCAIFTTINLLNSQAEEQKSSPYHKYYTSIQIQDGDSLWSIAEKYRTHSGKSSAEYVFDLKKMNSLSDDTIHAGHYLTVYYYDSAVKK